MNGMMKLSFGNMTIELSMFSLQRQSPGFDDIKFSTLIWVKDSIIDGKYDDMFVAEYESFLINDELEYDVLEFNDLYSVTDCLIASAFAFESFFPYASLELKLFLTLLSIHFYGPMNPYQ